MQQRIFFDIVLFLSLLLSPFPVTLFLIVLGFFLYPRYGEAIVAADLIERFYRGEGSDAWGSHLPLAVIALTILLLVEVLRTIIRERTR